MTKPELRKKYRTLRESLSIDAIENRSLDIANKLLEIPIWSKTYYHLFLSITEHKEINTDYILHILYAKDKGVVVSKSSFETRNMTNYLLTDSTIIKKNNWGIPEPIDGIEVVNEKIDVVFVPLLAFSKHGHRVGYGKGFYDKFLDTCDAETLKIGLSFFEAEDAIEGISINDIKLDFCVTPKTVYTF